MWDHSLTLWLSRRSQLGVLLGFKGNLLTEGTSDNEGTLNIEGTSIFEIDLLIFYNCKLIVSKGNRFIKRFLSKPFRHDQERLEEYFVWRTSHTYGPGHMDSHEYVKFGSCVDRSLSKQRTSGWKNLRKKKCIMWVTHWLISRSTKYIKWVSTVVYITSISVCIDTRYRVGWE